MKFLYHVFGKYELLVLVNKYDIYVHHTFRLLAHNQLCNLCFTLFFLCS